MSDDDSVAVAEFIRTKGITRCPTAFVLPTQALLGAADRAALEEHAATRDRLLRARAAINWENWYIPTVGCRRYRGIVRATATGQKSPGRERPGFPSV